MARQPQKPGNRLNRRGEVIPDTRMMSPYYGDNDYKTGMPLFATHSSSPARLKYKEARKKARKRARARKKKTAEKTS